MSLETLELVFPERFEGLKLGFGWGASHAALKCVLDALGHRSRLPG